MRVVFISKPVVKALFGSMFLLASGLAYADTEWLTWGHDPQRTGSNPDEKILNKDNVSQLEVKWIAQISTAPKGLHSLDDDGSRDRHGEYTAGAGRRAFSWSAATIPSSRSMRPPGKSSGKRRTPIPMKEPKQGDYRCPNSQNATPVIDKDAGIIYVSTNDGKLRGFSLLDGAERMPPTNFTDPFARNWSLNLIDGVIYSPTARGCLNMQSHFTALDLKDPVRHPLEYYTNTGITSGAWGRGGLVRGPKGILAQTADGPYDPASGKFGDSVVAVTAKNFRLAGLLHAGELRISE